MAISTAKKSQQLEDYYPEYLPESDGKPMAETDTHRQKMIDLLHSLEEHFSSDPDVYITGNIFLYLPRDEETGKQQPVSPDIFVVRGVQKKIRRIYNMEVEKKAPDVVIELTSRSTRFEDLGTKKAIYAELGVAEYFIFDPLQENFPPHLRGFYLVDGEYRPIDGAPLHSKVLKLDLVIEDDMLRLYHAQTGLRLRTSAEEAEARQKAEQKVIEEIEARREAEAEIERLRKALAELKDKSGK